MFFLFFDLIHKSKKITLLPICWPDSFWSNGCFPYLKGMRLSSKLKISSNKMLRQLILSYSINWVEVVFSDNNREQT